MTKSSKKFVWKVGSKLRENPEPLTLKELEWLSHLSVMWFNALFKEARKPPTPIEERNLLEMQNIIAKLNYLVNQGFKSERNEFDEKKNI